MSNLQHGFYSKNTSVNPDSVMIQNIAVKRALERFRPEIIAVVNEKMVKPGVTDLVVYLIDCVMPTGEHLLPVEHLGAIKEYYYSRAFKVLSRENRDKSLDGLIQVVEAF